MADRTVKVTLIAQATGYIQGMDQASRKTRELGSEAERLAQKRHAFEVVGRAMLAVGVAAAIGVGFAVAKFAEFDEAMSNVNAVTQETVANQNLLRDAALEAGGATVFTATESANAIEELAKAGIGTADVLGGALAGSLDLAASGQLSVARAAEITGITLKQFALDGTEAGRVADVLSAGANKAVGSVEDLAQGLKFVGPVAANMNVSLEDTVATLALFADQGIIGEQAGTSLRGMLSSLTSPSSMARKELDRLNISLYDSNGRFLGMEHAAGQLKSALGGVTDAERDMSLGILFGNQQITAARVLTSQGADAWRDYRNAVDDSGIAARIASARMDNLRGDLEKLGGAFDTALIQTGTGANDVLRQMVQTTTFLVDAVGELPQPLLAVGLGLGVVVAAVGIAGGGFLLLVPKISAAKIAMSTMGITAGGAARGIGAVSGAIAVATGLLAFFATTAANAAGVTSEFKSTLDPVTGAMTDLTRATIAQKVAESEWITNSARDIGVSQKEIVDALMEGGQALEDLQAKFKAQNNIVNFFNGSGVAAGNATQTIRELADGLESSKTQFDNQKEGAEGSARSTTTAADAYKTAADNAANLQSNLSSLIDTINKANGVGQDAVTTNAGYQEMLAKVADTIAQAQAGVDGYSTSIDESTAAGASNAAMFAELAGKSQDAAQAQLDLDGNVDNYLATLTAGRQTLYDQILALTGNADAAQLLTDKIYAIPTSTEVEVLVETTEAQRRLDAIQASLDRFKSSGQNLSAYIRSQDNFAGGIYDGGVKAFAAGGFASGIYKGVHGGIHKFAESEMGVPWEAYISGRTQDRERNIGLWSETGKRLGVWQSAPQYMQQPSAPAMSIEGMRITGRLDLGGGLEGMIDGRIESADDRTAQGIRGGLR